MRERIEQKITAFGQAFPDATTRFPQLVVLLDFVDRRERALAAYAAAHALAEEADRQEADLEPLLSLFESARRALKLKRLDGQALADEVQAVCSALAIHEAGHTDYRRDLRDSEEADPKAKRADQDLADLLGAHDQWQQQWNAALSGLGLDAELAPERGGALISEWSGARAILGTIAQSRTRLDRMDEDEAALQAAVVALGSKLDLSLPQDPLAAAELITARWREQDAIRLQRAALTPEIEETKADCVALETGEQTALAAVAALAGIAAVENDDKTLMGVAGRCAARAALLQEQAQANRSIADVSDGLDIAALREQAAGRDVDTLRGALAVAQEQSAQLDSDIEAAILATKPLKMRSIIERVRSEQQDPLVSRAGELFALTTQGEFAGIDTDIDDKGLPVVIGRRQSGAAVSVAAMSDGTRDQLFLAFRLANLENYAAAAEPLPFVADDILVHFDDERSAATLDLLVRFAETNQVLLFTYHKSVRDDARRLEKQGRANIVEIERLS